MRDFVMAFIASASMEFESFKGLLWYLWYRIRYSRLLGEEMANLGPIPVPAPLERFLPYAKFVVSLAALVATVVVTVVAAPPAWAFMIIAAAGALGVVVVPNKDVRAVYQDGLTAVRAGEAAVSAAQAGNLAAAEADATAALRAAQGGVSDATQVYRDLPKP